MGSETAVKDWLAENWSLDITLREWWNRLAASGFGFPRWPVEWFGAGMDKTDATDVARAFRAANIIGAPTGLGTLMGAPVVMEHGTHEQRSRLLPPLATGTEGWCQLFSEPGAGSDLASVSTRAVLDGDEWIITGQKVWTSGAPQSRRGMLVARSDFDAPKHRGLTYFIIDLDQPGIDIRPLHQMNGKSHFSEVFLTEARVHDRDRIAGVNAGWGVTLATLQYERSGLSSPQGGLKPSAGESAGNLDRTVGELLAQTQSGRKGTTGAGEGDGDDTDETEPGSYATLARLARSRTLLENHTICQDLASLYSLERIAEFSQQRSAASVKAGRSPGPESSVAKLFWTESLRASSSLAMRILGPWGTLTGRDTPENGRVQTFVLSVPSASIAGGSDEIQRNIMGERALGLPREPSVDTDIPFKDLRKS